MSNFKFLKDIDNDLFKIISDAEKLYRDEYFEQSIIQTRRFAENVCKNLLGERLIPDATFDDCLAILQDIYTKNIRQREVINDLYFLFYEMVYLRIYFLLIYILNESKNIILLYLILYILFLFELSLVTLSWLYDNIIILAIIKQHEQLTPNICIVIWTVLSLYQTCGFHNDNYYL